MEYLDSTIRLSSNALAHWLSQEVPGEQAHLRIKTGYFTLDGLGGLKSSVDHLVLNDLPITIALGANEQATIKSDVDSLYALIGCPRPNARLCVISCIGGLFHPKVVHLTRTDGSAFAYVGSANVTSAGLNGTNIEAGILLDSRKGDPIGILDQIAVSIDDWFKGPQAGVTNIGSLAITQQLVSSGILGAVKQVKKSGSLGASGGAPSPPRMPLTALVSFPTLVTPTGGNSTSSQATPQSASSTSTPSQGFGSQEILIAEIGKGDRWKQANFPYLVMQGYFGVNPTGNGYIDLIPVDLNGTASAPVSTKAVNVQSKNYRLELGSVAGMAFPASGRPIAVFRKVGSAQFRYHVFFPSDPSYAALQTGLTQLYQGPLANCPAS
ncbi:phospholipase D family protein [Novosphingobium sp.]|uniref:phospholipase D family protein n=1 Tax=Novosphingobium sp. TaxID=1874826 RepID=UPI0025FCD872|nr:phospholipase D family protein [Novosphingobium sp.]